MLEKNTANKEIAAPVKNAAAKPRESTKLPATIGP
ncbi:MAG: hypothetical protein RLZZ183_869, partial [Actinomycetota bacterium]